MRNDYFTTMLRECVSGLVEVEYLLSKEKQACTPKGFFWVYGGIFKESFIHKLLKAINHNRNLQPTAKTSKIIFGIKNKTKT